MDDTSLREAHTKVQALLQALRRFRGQRPIVGLGQRAIDQDEYADWYQAGNAIPQLLEEAEAAAQPVLPHLIEASEGAKLLDVAASTAHGAVLQLARDAVDLVRRRTCGLEMVDGRLRDEETAYPDRLLSEETDGRALFAMLGLLTLPVVQDWQDLQRLVEQEAYSAHGVDDKRSYMTRQQAEQVAKENYKQLWPVDNQSEWARVIGCSRKVVPKLETWHRAKKRREGKKALQARLTGPVAHPACNDG